MSTVPCLPSCSRRGFLYSLAGARLLAPKSLAAQEKSSIDKISVEKETTFSTDVKVINVFASVRDKQGHIVSNLSKDDFTLTEDGRNQAIRYFSRESDLPLTLGLLVDTSLSQRRVLGQEKAASFRFLDKVLRGRDGFERLVMDVKHRGLDSHVDSAPEEGVPLTLTIDERMQYVAERELKAGVELKHARYGTAIVMNPYTGEILALASFPSFNPNDYTDSQPDQRRDRAMSDVFEPGSSMKMFTVAAGLTDGVITPTQKMYCEKGVMQIDNVTIRDTHPSEWLTIPQILAISSNICAAKIGLGMGESKLYEAFRRFGFGQESGLPFPGEAQGTLRPRSRPWVQVETASAAFGQGIGVTNVQMAMAAAAIANGGELMEPLLVRKVTTSTGEVVREVSPHVRRRVISKDVARAVSEMLVAVTEGEGTGVEAAIDGYRVAGKTATAQKTDPKTGRYSIDKYIASFVGFVPAEKPVVAIAVTVDEPMVEHAGGAVAAPIFRHVAQMALKLAGLTPKTADHTDVAVLARTPDPANIAYEALREAQGKKPPVQEVLPSGPVPAGKVRIPNLTGVPARQALKQMIELGLVPHLKGSGLIVTQQPPPGSIVDGESEVLLVLEPAS